MRFLVLICVLFWRAKADNGLKAHAVLMTNSQLGISQRLGVVTFTQSGPDAPVQISGELTFETRNQPITMLGMHVHTYGNLSLGCDSTGAHFNPTGQQHGSQTEDVRHVGDLGNIIITNQRSVISISDSVVRLSGPHSIIGRALVIHQGEDDLGKGGNEESLKTGNAGKRWACGVIGLASDDNDFQPTTSGIGSSNNFAFKRMMSLIAGAILCYFAKYCYCL